MYTYQKMMMALMVMMNDDFLSNSEGNQKEAPKDRHFKMNVFR